MLILFVTLLLISEGITVSDICNEPSNCKPPESPQDFPETKEELQEICKGIEFLECKYEYDEACHPHATGILEYGQKTLELAREICSEDTLLHAAIVDNLKCFKKLLDEESPRCPADGESTERLQNYVEALSEEGLVTLTDNENDTNRLYICIERVNSLACRSLKVERRCGIVAMNAFVEIIQKGGPIFESCGDTFRMLPALIRLRRAEEEEVNSIADIFRKRK